MSGVIFLLGAALLGIGLVRWFFGARLNHAEQVIWGLVLGWSGAAVAGYALARVFGGLSYRLGLVVLVLVWIVAIISWLPTIRRLSRRETTPLWDRSFAPLVVLLCFFAPIYGHLFSTHMLQLRGDGGIYSGGESTSYDMAFHAAITNSFVHGANFPAIYTPMPPAPLVYPFLPDFLSALLVVLGMDLHAALVGTAIPLCLALTGIFYFLALRLLKLTESIRIRPTGLGWIAATAAILFLFNGGLGFVYLIQDWRASGTTLWQFFSTIELNYTHIAGRGLLWPNIITDMLLPQRTSIFGLSLGFITLTCFTMISERKGDGQRSDWQVLLGAGILAGLLPYFHIHSYTAVGLMSGCLFLLRPRRLWLVFWLPALVLAFPRLLELGGQLTGAGFTRFQPGWRGQEESNWLVFWVRNIGLPTLLIIPAWFTASRPLRRWYLSFVALLLLALVVVFSPNDYDNLKLMAYWYGGTCIVIAGWLAHLAQSRIGLACLIGCVLVSTLSGALAVVYECRASKLMFGREEIAAADFVKSNTAPHSLFLTAPSLHQPVLSLAGRAVVRGPTAWLWSHGYSFAEREADVRAIYAGREDAMDLLRYYRVDYVYLGDKEARDLRANKAFFDASFPAIYRVGNITIYDARKSEEHEPTRPCAYPPREYANRVDRDPAQFLSAFPDVAFEVYRLRKVAFGGTPRYGEFMADLRQLGRGLYLGAPGWRAVLTDNRRMLCDEWTGRPEFKERSDEQYVDALLANAGLTLSESEKARLRSGLVSGRETRSSVLHRISSDPRLYQREYTDAYLLCHYFGYLRRNPDEPPDHDLSGYNFWRQQLRRTKDFRGLTRAFIEADEYKRQIR